MGAVVVAITVLRVTQHAALQRVAYQQYLCDFPAKMNQLSRNLSARNFSSFQKRCKSSILSVKAREIIDSRGNPTVEVNL